MDKIYLAFSGISDITRQLNPANTNTTVDTSKLSTIQNTLYFNITTTLVLVISIGAVLSLVYGGFLYITAGGDPEKAETGKRVIMYTVIAIILVILAYMIFNLARKVTL